MADDDPTPVPRQANPPLADVTTLVNMGVVDEQPQPPQDLPPDPSAQEQANAATLDTALAAAGITQAPADADAIAELAKLDPAIVDVIARWVQGDPIVPPPAEPEK